MPYIKSKEDRERLNKILLDNFLFFTKKGNINYFLCKLFTLNEINYGNARNFIGELECAKLELYRRFVAPYEDLKKKENGDIC